MNSIITSFLFFKTVINVENEIVALFIEQMFIKIL